jgi:hypothetical protein
MTQKIHKTLIETKAIISSTLNVENENNYE